MKTLTPKTLTRLLFLFLFCIIAGTGFYLYKGKIPAPDIRVKDVDVDSEAAMKLNLVEQISQKNGITEWELKASSASLLSGEEKAVLENVQVVFYTKTQEKILLSADHGELNTTTHDMQFLYNVVAKHGTYTLKTDKLHYKKKPHIIQSDAPIWLENKDSTVQADAMIMELRTSRITLIGNVKGKFSETFRLP